MTKSNGQRQKAAGAPSSRRNDLQEAAPGYFVERYRFFMRLYCERDSTNRKRSDEFYTQMNNR
jgi:hypothetical protein